MKVKVKAFGIAREIFGHQHIEMALDGGSTVGTLKQGLQRQYPQLEAIRSYVLAVNHEYAEDTVIIQESDEIAIIPPVSGG
jgi:molybdopterin synthase sulfur carrier subunit